ncbi:MAG: hypothetical protein ACPGVO_20235, partial [Spirulinaceae cyanobacterium]
DNRLIIPRAGGTPALQVYMGSISRSAGILPATRRFLCSYNPDFVLAGKGSDRSSFAGFALQLKYKPEQAWSET